MAFICTNCGQKIVSGATYKYKNKNVCISCFNKLIQQDIQIQQARKNLYQYICQLFSLTECPYEIINAIDRLEKDGKTINGIKATIYYYYSILGNEYNPDHRYYFFKIVNENYYITRDYFKKQKEIREINDKIDINVPPIHVQVAPNELGKKRRHQIKYKMEDL